MQNPLHSVYSVHSVVNEFFNHRMHRIHRFFGGRELLMFGPGGLGKRHQLFGEQMDSVIEELNGGLVA